MRTPELCERCLRFKPCGCVAHLVTDAEIDNSNFVRDVRNFFAAQPVEPADRLDHILRLYAKFKGRIVDRDGHPVRLNTERQFLPTDKDIDAGQGKIVEERIQNWFEETFTPVPNHVTPHVRVEAWERFRIVATILRASFPVAAMMWAVRPANDNDIDEQRRK